MAIGWIGGTALGHRLPVAPRGPLAVAATFLPLAFVVVLLPTQWAGARSLPPWIVSAAVALVVAGTSARAGPWLGAGGAGTLVSALRGDA